MIPSTSQFYDGSRFFESLCGPLHLSIDQLNFLLCQLFALVFGLFFRFVVPPSSNKSSKYIRLNIELWVGLALTLFCFGRQTIYPLALSAGCYALIRFRVSSNFHALVLVLSVSVLSAAHILRVIYDFGGYTLDITGPMMIIIQRTTSIAYSIHDGTVKEESRVFPSHRPLAIKRVPSVLEFFSYIFYFHGIICGPFVFFNDYMDFIYPSWRNEDANKNDKSSQPSKISIPPWPKVLVLRLGLYSLVCGALMMFVLPLTPPEYIGTTGFMQLPFWKKSLFILVSLTVIKQKYYFAWVLAELVNVVAGLGYTGPDKNGNPTYDLVDNVTIFGVEFCTSLKINIDSWNKSTVRWLRFLVYERTSEKHSLWLVFGLSAFWHGFYPGYYITFVSGAMFLHAARKVRRVFRERFQGNAFSRFAYDCFTFWGTRFYNVYIALGFVILEFNKTLQVYWSLYFCLHIVGILGILLLPNKPSSRTTPNKNKEQDTHDKTS